MGYKKDQAKLLRKRILHVLRTNPDITNQQLRARFGNRNSLFSELRREVGTACPRSEFVTVDDLKSAKHVEPNMVEHDRFGRSW